jgi:hypothetical protein
MSSTEYNVKYPKDENGYYYLDKNNCKIYFLNDDEGYYYLDKNNNKTYIFKFKKEGDVEIENTNINKLSTYLMKELCSSGYINKNINPHEIRNIIKTGIKKFINPESHKCKATITTNNHSYRCNAPTKPNSEYCGRKHKF